MRAPRTDREAKKRGDDGVREGNQKALPSGMLPLRRGADGCLPCRGTRRRQMRLPAKRGRCQGGGRVRDRIRGMGWGRPEVYTWS